MGIVAVVEPVERAQPPAGVEAATTDDGLVAHKWLERLLAVEHQPLPALLLLVPVYIQQSSLHSNPQHGIGHL